VRDVCERANVGRTTFYLHYPNKDALLQGGLNELQTGLQGQAQALLPSAGSSLQPPGLRFMPGLIAHAHEQRQIFCGLIGRRSGHVVQQRFREMVIRLIGEELPESPGKLPRWLAGAFVELLSW
jgi:AcrR family transcriptional regulator